MAHGGRAAVLFALSACAGGYMPRPLLHRVGGSGPRVLRVQLAATEAQEAPAPAPSTADSGSKPPVFILNNPKYVRRKKVVPQQRRPQQQQRTPQPGGSRGGPPTGRPDQGSRPASRAPQAGKGFSMPGMADDDDSRDLPPPSGENAKPTSNRRQTKMPDKAKATDRDGAPRRDRGFRGRRGGGRAMTEEEATATARTPRKKQRGKRNVVVAPPPPSGPARVVLDETITVGELAAALDVGAAAVVKDLMKMGVLASITQSIDADTAETIATGFGAVVVRGREGAQSESELVAGGLGVIEEEDDESLLVRRPPVVTIMGHVDHGKTSLLDALRSGNVAAGEAGGITQHIGAYSVPFPEGVGSGGEERSDRATFIDTPGHAAFSEMRSRGANVTDVVILVVAADDGVMEQTMQSINAAKAADVPMIVAITKSDKPDADAQKVKMQLLEKEVVLEDFGGEVLAVEVSAKEGTGLTELMEQISMQADVLELKSNPKREATGTIIEARQVVGQGSVATVLVQRGTLSQGDIVVAGAQWGRVRSLLTDTGERVEEALPSDAVELVGLSGLPEAGDALTVVPDDARARELAETRQRLLRERRSSSLFASRSTAEQQMFLGGLTEGELPTKLLDFVVKSDVQGSAEALTSALSALEAADDKLQVKTRVLRSGAGAITNEDIMLAGVSNAVVIGFNTAASAQQRDEALKVGVEIQEFEATNLTLTLPLTLTPQGGRRDP